MAEYEVVREVQNLCGNNQMRDVFFEEIETDDPELSYYTWLTITRPAACKYMKKSISFSILGMAGTPARQSLVMRIFWLTPPQTT